jgi:SAM-dependent methyltransferase
MSACIVSQLTEVARVLDLPCGHGHVLRHLVAMFPDAVIDACDLDAEGVDFCASTFEARPIHSQEDLTKVKFDASYDIIWIGSLFTHTSRAITAKWLQFLADLLSPKGIIVATFHGRWAIQLQRLVPYIDNERWQDIVREYESSGYGYQDYKREDSHDFISESYGVSVAKPHGIVSLLETIPGIRIHMYQEKAWANNHELALFGKPDWDEAWW